MPHDGIGQPPQRERCRRRHPEQQDKPAQWWPPGPEGIRHPLKGEKARPLTARTRSSQSTPTPRAAGYALHTARSARPSHKQFETGMHNSSVPLGEHVHRPQSFHRKGRFENAAGQTSDKHSSHAGPKTGYAWGNAEQAQEHIKKAFQGAAGSCTSQMSQHHGRTKQMHPSDERRAASEKNFHRGISGEDPRHKGVYDFRPTSQGQRARAAPKRVCQVKSIIFGGGGGGPQKSASMPGEAFQGQFTSAYDAAAGRSAGQDVSHYNTN